MKNNIIQPTPKLMPTNVRTPAVAILASLTFLPLASAVIIVDTGFEESNFAATGLIDLSNIRNPQILPGAGTSASRGLDFDSDGAAASARVTIAPSTYFSMMGLFNGNTNGGDGAGMTFGWTRANDPFNPYFGDAGPVDDSFHVNVGITRTATTAFRLAANLGGTSDLNPGNSFGTPAVNLTNGNWYRLEGTVLFDSLNKVFTFSNISVDDFGASGAAEVTANILSGTSAPITANGFGTDGRALYMTNRDRGFGITDNYFAQDPTVAVIPEPTSSALFALGALGLVLRRRVN